MNGEIKSPRFDIEVSEVTSAISIILRTEVLKASKAA
jgi:hypothetical protein